MRVINLHCAMVLKKLTIEFLYKFSCRVLGQFYRVSKNKCLEKTCGALFYVFDLGLGVHWSFTSFARDSKWGCRL